MRFEKIRKYAKEPGVSGGKYKLRLARFFILKKEFPGLSGYSARNLCDMRRLYLEYKDNEKLRRLVAEIPWGQNLVIMSRVKNYKERINTRQAKIWTFSSIIMSKVRSLRHPGK